MHCYTFHQALLHVVILPISILSVSFNIPTIVLAPPGSFHRYSALTSILFRGLACCVNEMLDLVMGMHVPCNVAASLMASSLDSHGTPPSSPAYPLHAKQSNSRRTSATLGTVGNRSATLTRMFVVRRSGMKPFSSTSNQSVHGTLLEYQVIRDWIGGARLSSVISPTLFASPALCHLHAPRYIRFAELLDDVDKPFRW